MNNIDKIKRQLAKPISIKLTNEDGEEDEFMFKRLNVEQQAILMEVGKRVQSRDMEIINGKEVPSVSKDDMIEMGDLILDVVKSSMQEIDEVTAKDFVSNNFNQLSDALVDLMPKEQGNVELMKKKLEEARNAKQQA